MEAILTRCAEQAGVRDADVSDIKEHRGSCFSCVRVDASIANGGTGDLAKFRKHLQAEFPASTLDDIVTSGGEFNVGITIRPWTSLLSALFWLAFALLFCSRFVLLGLD